MFARGTRLTTQCGRVPVEDLDEGHRIALPTPHGIELAEVQEPELRDSLRVMVLMRDGRNLILHPRSLLHTKVGPFRAGDARPGLRLEGETPGQVESVIPCSTSPMYGFPRLEGQLVQAEGLLVRCTLGQD